MFESIRDSMKEAVHSIQSGYESFSASMDDLQKDLVQIRDIFVNVRDWIANVFSFMGQQTSILLLCTLIFLFVINLIPFLFFDKKSRYFMGIGFGILLAFYFRYTALATAKYLLIMLSPMILEYVLVKGVKFFWHLFRYGFKGAFFSAKELMHVSFRRLFAQRTKKDNGGKDQLIVKKLADIEKEPENQKENSQEKDGNA